MEHYPKSSSACDTSGLLQQRRMANIILSLPDPLSCGFLHTLLVSESLYELSTLRPLLLLRRLDEGPDHALHRLQESLHHLLGSRRHGCCGGICDGSRTTNALLPCKAGNAARCFSQRDTGNPKWAANALWCTQVATRGPTQEEHFRTWTQTEKQIQKGECIDATTSARTRIRIQVHQYMRT